jgi:hypothetical protein
MSPAILKTPAAQLRTLTQLHLKPIGRAAGAVGRVLSLRHDPFEPGLQAWRKMVSPSSCSRCSFSQGRRAGARQAMAGKGSINADTRMPVVLGHWPTLRNLHHACPQMGFVSVVKVISY